MALSDNIRNLTVEDIVGPRFKITREGGYAVKIRNGTGAPSVKGTLLSCSTTEDLSVILQANEYDTVGVCYEDGVAAGEYLWMVISGMVDVLLVNGQASTRGQLLVASATDGRATTLANPGSGLPAVDIHFKECGHVLESKAAGTNVLCRCIIHFN